MSRRKRPYQPAQVQQVQQVPGKRPSGAAQALRNNAPMPASINPA